MTWRMLTGVLLTILGNALACSRAAGKTSDDAQLPEITSYSEHGTAYVDLGFLIRSRQTLASGAQALRVAGLHEGREVGATVVLDTPWKKGPLSSDGRNFAYRGTVTWRSSGAKSDALLHVLDLVYQTKLHPGAMRRETTFTGVSLEGVPTDLAKGAVLIELSVAPNVAFYINIMVDDHALEIREKDHEARAVFIKALQSK